MTATHPYKQVIYFKINEGPDATRPPFYTAAIPKVGWHSFRAYARQYQCGVATAEEVRQDRNTSFFFFIRRPYERLRAAWAYHNSQAISLPAHLGRASWTEFCDAVLAGVMDHHWAPQIEGLAREPDEVFQFERVGEVWPYLTGHALPRLNDVKSSKPVEQYRRKELEEIYWLDNLFWRGAE